MNDDEQRLLLRIDKLKNLVGDVLKQARNLSERDKRRGWIQKRVSSLKDDLDVLLGILKEGTADQSFGKGEPPFSEWDEPLDKIENELQNLNDSLPKSKECLRPVPAGKSQEEPPISLPSEWGRLTVDVIYHTKDGRKVKFSRQQINLGQRFDRNNKHLKAIESGDVRPVDNQGLVPSDKTGFDKKSKVLGKGGDYRFQAKYEGDVLYFPGVRTAH